MREIVFALEFRGRAGPVPGSDSKRQARSTAPSQTLATVLERDGVRARIDATTGDTAVLESRVERFGDGTFVEDGTITYGARRVGDLRDDRPRLGGAGAADRLGGRWRAVDHHRGGTGAFRGARGLITSNFTVSAEGEVVDDHFVRLYLP